MHLRKPSYILLLGLIALPLALAFAAYEKAHRPAPPIVPRETAIHVTLNHALSSEQNKPGDHFEATISEPVVVANKIVIPQGTQVEGLVIDVHHSGRLRGRARLRLALDTVAVNGMNYQIRTDSSTRVGGNHKMRNIGFIGGGAGGGLLVGALAGGAKGALIGGPVGAGAGTAVAFLTGKKDIRLPAETELTFRLAEPVTINEKS